MKKIVSALVAALMLAVTLLPTVMAQPLQANAVIVIPENASITEKYAAEALQKGIGEVTKQTVSIVADNEKTDAFKFLVGATAMTVNKPVNETDGSYIIKSGNNCIEINGNGNKGTIYGVYRFLEEYAGFKMYSEKTGYKSYTGKLEMPDNADISYTPYFEYTDTDWLSPRNDIYSLANGLNGGVYRSLTPEQGGTVKYLGTFCHTFTTLFCSRDKYYDEHPEYFALRDGKRNPKQLCLTNEDVYNVVLGEVMELLEKEHDENASLQIISLTQNDSNAAGDYCLCDNCKALDAANGSPSGTMITFVNRIAKAVKEAGYDNVALDTFAYRYTRKAPTNVVPEKNVIVRLCSIECCFTHALDDSTCERNVEFMQDLADWNNICDHIYIWDYTTNYAYTVGIFPDFGTIQKNAQIFAEHGVKGVYEEGNYYITRCDTEFGEMRAYLLSRLMQNPYCDLEKETEGFLNAFYGEGGDEIGEFLRLVTANAEKKHAEIYDEMYLTFSFTEKEAENIDALWAKAKADTADDEFALANITRSEISWRYVKSSLGLREFSELFQRGKENKKLYADILALGTKTFSENMSGEDNTAVLPLYEYLRPKNWQNINGLSVYTYSVDIAVMTAALVLALIVLFAAIKRKEYAGCALLPLFGMMVGNAILSRNTFLAWDSLAKYTISAVCLIALAAAVALVYAKLSGMKVKKCIISVLVNTLIFAVFYGASLLVINNALYHGKANDFAMSIAYFFASLYAVIFTIRVLSKLHKNKRSEKEEKAVNAGK